MAIVLQLATAHGEFLQESYEILDDELREYFSAFETAPLLESLWTRGRSPFDAELTEGLARELAALAESAGRRALPPPPDWVGLDETGDLRLGEEFGWPGLLAFLERVSHLLHLSRVMGLEMWTVPED